jgi:single-stranded-DNA-specific exonuclease
MAGPVPELDDRADACARRLTDADAVLLASHIDADGLTSAAVASSALERAGIPHEVVFKKQLDETEIASIAATDHDVVCFTDFGSGQLDVISEHEARGDFEPVIADHHQPADATTEYHLNPLLEGIDGASELSGAGAAYVLARALETTAGGDGSTTSGGDESTGVDNRDLAALAVVGAVGDMQESDGELVGANAAIVEEGVAVGALDTAKDLAVYGKQTRPLPKLLEYASDVAIPGITNDPDGVRSFLADTSVDPYDDGDWRTWVDLSPAERREIVSALVQHAVKRGVPASQIETLVATSYTLPNEPAGTELRDASEFSTLLNATARYERADVGLAVCLGERGEPLERARDLLANHRRNLSEGVEFVENEGVTFEEHVQWFDADDRIRETIVGIVAGMALGADGVARDRPIVAFANEDDAHVKVSARGTHRLVRDGLDLSSVMREAARAVGGDGGGHDVAAGATIPRGERSAFLTEADRVVGDQLDTAN